MTGNTSFHTDLDVLRGPFQPQLFRDYGSNSWQLLPTWLTGYHMAPPRSGNWVFLRDRILPPPPYPSVPPEPATCAVGLGTLQEKRDA